MKTINRIAVLLALALLAGCYTQEKTYIKRGKDFEESKRNTLQMGMRRDEVIDLLGEPHGECADPDSATREMTYYFEHSRSRRQLVYGHETVSSENLVYKQLVVTLEDGAVKRFHYEDTLRFE